MTSCDLSNKHCKPCEGGVPRLSAAEVKANLANLNGWESNEDATWISKKFSFTDFSQTMSFVNAIAHMANQEGHHPDLEVGYGYCHVKYQTHAIDGLSENDFICALKVEGLL